MVVKISRGQATSWRLTKQHLMERASKGRLTAVVSEICGVQAQVMSGATMSIWARVRDVSGQDLDQALWKERRLVKTWCMRGTLHLLAADDLPLYVAALKTRTGYRDKAWLKFHRISIDEIDSITSETRNSLDGQCLTREDLVNDIVRRAGLRRWVKQEMSSGWGSLLHPSAYRGNLCFGPSQGKNVTFVRPDQWLGRWDEPSGEEAVKTLLRRFVASYGPCSHEDFGHWWGVPPGNARKIFRPILDELEEVDFNGRKSWVRKEDVNQLKGSIPRTSLRLVPAFDPYIMFYSPRELLVEDKFRARVFRQLAGWNSPVLLIDGVAAGIWRYRKRAAGIQVIIEAFRRLSHAERQLIEEESRGLGEFFGTRAELSFAS